MTSTITGYIGTSPFSMLHPAVHDCHHSLFNYRNPSFGVLATHAASNSVAKNTVDEDYDEEASKCCPIKNAVDASGVDAKVRGSSTGPARTTWSKTPSDPFVARNKGQGAQRSNREQSLTSINNDELADRQGQIKKAKSIKSLISQSANNELVGPLAFPKMRSRSQEISAQKKCARKLSVNNQVSVLTLQELYPFQTAISTAEAAKVLGFAEQTLHKWASLGNGPLTPLRLRRRLLWRLTDLESILAGR